MKKENINRLYQLMVEDDEMLMGSQWEEMYCNEYDTPKSILNNFINIYLATNFVDVDDDLQTTPLANQEEKIVALIKYLEKIINDLKNRISSENNINNWGGKMKYRKKPVVIEAIKYEKEHIDRALDFCDNNEHIKYNPEDNEYYIHTLEGDMKVSEGDYIIKGINGEFYPCKPDIFEKTYEKLDEEIEVEKWTKKKLKK